MTPQLAVIEIVVDEMARSLNFYRQLGLELPTDLDDEPHVEAELPGGLKLAWDTVETVRGFDPEWSAPPAGAHRMALAFDCSDPAEVDSTYTAMIESGAASGHLEPWDAFWGMRYAVLLDPDGMTVDLFAQL